ncbi:MAG: peptide chain release factor N(5)-glutamine methyltransferase [Shewanella sp.]|nr:peptide chain release factor N(5)-glutamine methyltransferase [Shewanella sp.]MCF1429865.1 peptide chain release factor N(5)-glutamine methyltransferase [Shewanella sp.]MCF1457825.1 peptide chain release factor N(5)-glutamine methyltransferase [Shewanella sp.]
MSGISIDEALKWASVQLERVSESATLDAEVMLQHVLGKSRTYLYTWPDKSLSSEHWQAFMVMVNERAKGHPVAHITGEREFWSLPLLVNKTTLIPRPDTEILVETALNLSLPESSRVLDLGTGTGAIALALASERAGWQVTGVDRVADAVTLAKMNRDRLKLEQVEILQSDWFFAVAERQFELVVSNPPYIDEQDEHLAQGDVRFEPLSALTAADEGFADLFYIATEARIHLLPGGYLLMEHGYQQAKLLRQKMIELGYQDVATVRDFGSNDRCTLGRWPG